MLSLQQANLQDLDRIMELIAQAKAYLFGLGVDQWQNGYPDEDCIREDLQAEKGYLLLDGGETVGYICLDLDGEPSYGGLNGRWKSIQPYLVAHRLTIDDAHKGKGLSAEVFRLMEEFCRERSIHSIKVDTDNDNLGMKHILDQCGYEYCGTIWFDNSEKIAYEKLV